MTRQRGFGLLKGLALLLGVFALGALVARLGGLMPPAAGQASEPPSVTPSVYPDDLVLLGTKSPVTLQPSYLPTLGGTAVGPTTPADAWANTLLDQVVPALQQPRPSPDGFGWWQSSEASGLLAFAGNILTLDQQPLHLEGQNRITIAVVGQTNPNQLEQVADIAYEQGALALSVGGTLAPVGGARWILSDTDPNLAIEALVVQAAARAIALRAAYIENPDLTAEMVLVGIEPLGMPGATPSNSLPTATPTASHTATPLPAPTPTRVPDPYLGRVIAEAIDPVIDAAGQFLPDVVAAFVDWHPRTGFLTWAETGPQINGQPMGINQANELTFYTLAPNDPAGTVSSFLKVVYNGSTTRLPEKQVYFQGQRVEEILFWLVARASERGGRLRVAYDDFGARQAITVIGFSPSTPPGD